MVVSHGYAAQTVRAGSMGKRLPGTAVLIVDPMTGKRVTIGEGEICLDLEAAPINLMTGYVDSEAPWRNGLYHTGDLVEADSDGYITYVGRTDDVFEASDYKISPFEIESVLIEHPAVVEAASSPHPIHSGWRSRRPMWCPPAGTSLHARTLWRY